MESSRIFFTRFKYFYLNFWCPKLFQGFSLEFLGCDNPRIRMEFLGVHPHNPIFCGSESRSIAGSGAGDGSGDGSGDDSGAGKTNAGFSGSLFGSLNNGGSKSG